MKNALIVIDVQKFFAVEKAKDIPLKVAEHIEQSKYDYVLFTKFRNDPNSNFHKLLNWKLATKSPEIDIHPILVPFVNNENLFEKTTYSAFKSKEFVNFLRTKKIDEIYLCGINLDGCVLATAYEAFDLGFKVEILEELCSVSSSKKEYEDSAKVIIRRNLRPKI